MECFRQIGRCLKSPFQRKQAPKGLEIVRRSPRVNSRTVANESQGHPTNFRKEKTPVFFSDDE
ncbi:uncharacterized protein EURHEDRAFT_411168 [Aspergillus ruber CBS 135680]|uniref:Uncharacterized protein n=1 Tax=Aspergillus ruber (strain CBS 135680) TaxID=1388766 RepID=A0A017SJ33_ASPRC|nr:uncharacterized protein EURHEDRAFT_411168 [Aspergillus ruber CBS 135680]EYE96659.1 hypothetical protein EURHEDRAFT_411168 [Aspergillus ruber CBS 135680]